MIVQLTIRDNLIYFYSFSNFCLNPLTPLSRFTFSLTAILSAQVALVLQHTRPTVRLQS